jgi:hypothetical protein
LQFPCFWKNLPSFKNIYIYLFENISSRLGSAFSLVASFITLKTYCHLLLNPSWNNNQTCNIWKLKKIHCCHV